MTAQSDILAAITERHADLILKSLGSKLSNYMPETKKAALMAVLDAIEEGYRAGAEFATSRSWLPIESAPRDGSWFVSLMPYGDGEFSADMSRWDHSSKQFCRVGCGWQYCTCWMPLPVVKAAGAE